MTDEFLSIKNETKGKLPRLPFSELKNAILGKNYELSVVFTTPAKMKKLNGQFRKKDYATNVLSFELSKKSGELFLCPTVIKKQVVDFDMSVTKLTGYLVIHGMLHLKGHEHGSTMDKSEQRFVRKYL